MLQFHVALRPRSILSLSTSPHHNVLSRHRSGLYPGRSSRYAGVLLPGNQLPAFMQTREPLLGRGRACAGRAAALLTKEEVNMEVFMLATVPRCSIKTSSMLCRLAQSQIQNQASSFVDRLRLGEPLRHEASLFRHASSPPSSQFLPRM